MYLVSLKQQACPKGKHVQDTLGNNNVRLSSLSTVIDHVELLYQEKDDKQIKARVSFHENYPDSIVLHCL